MSKKEEPLLPRIKEKFGSLSNFARASKRPRYDLQLIFARKFIPKETLEDLEKLYNELDGDPVGNVITEEQLDKFKTKIDAVGGVYQFCKANPEFSQRQVYEVYSGNRLRISKLVKKLFQHFKIKIQKEKQTLD